MVNINFDDLPPGKYFLKFIPPAGCSFSSNDQTVDSLDSDVNGTFGYDHGYYYVEFR
ncbi:MAG: hypothetical protein U0T81_10575 [Saprospiraceae bacterium]